MKSARQEEFRDPTIGTVLSAEYSLDTSTVSRSLFMRNSTVGDRTRLDAVLGVATVGRGDEKHSTTFSDLGIKKFTNEQVGPSSANAVVILLNQRKRETEVTGRQFLSLLRHRAPLLCGVNALAVYLHRRWEINGEEYPNLVDGRNSWYDIQLFAHFGKASDKTKQLSYSATYDQVQSVFKEHNHSAHSANHYWRKKGIDSMSIDGQGSLDKGEERRLAGHNLDEHDSVYALNVPLAAAMVQAGFPAVDGNRLIYLIVPLIQVSRFPWSFSTPSVFFAKPTNFSSSRPRILTKY